MGSKRLRNRQKQAGTRRHGVGGMRARSSSRSETFPSFGPTAPFPRGLLIFAFVGVGLALIVFIAQGLALHHWI